MHRVNDTITIDDAEITGELRARLRPGGQNVNKVSVGGAAALRRARLAVAAQRRGGRGSMRLAGKRLTKDGVIVIIAQHHRTRSATAPTRASGCPI